MTASESSVTAEFEGICREISSKEDSYSDEVEDDYEKLLRFLSQSSSSRQMLVGKLIEIVNSYRHSRQRGAPSLSVDALAFCMHELRWPEIRAAAMAEQKDYFSKKMDQTLIPLIDAYDDERGEPGESTSLEN